MSVVEFTGKTRLDTAPSRVVQAALDANLKQAIVIGWDADGTFYANSSVADGGDALWLLELAKQRLMHAATTD